MRPDGLPGLPYQAVKIKHMSNVPDMAALVSIDRFYGHPGELIACDHAAHNDLNLKFKVGFLAGE